MSTSSATPDTPTNTVEATGAEFLTKLRNALKTEGDFPASAKNDDWQLR